MIQKTTIARCPLCSGQLTTSWVPYRISYFGEVMLITSQCGCGFRFSDTLILSQHKPVRYELKVEKQDDLNARVVRSTTATIRIPELGIDIEPGPASEAFISNIEGVLERVKNVLEMTMHWGEKEKKQAKKLLSIIEDIKEGKFKITVIIEDPFGNSAIISKNA